MFTFITKARKERRLWFVREQARHSKVLSALLRGALDRSEYEEKGGSLLRERNLDQV